LRTKTAARNAARGLRRPARVRRACALAGPQPAVLERPPMLRAVRLANLRSLGDTGKLALRPLTMLVGANSSGKSTLLRFFPLLRQTDSEESGSPLLFFGADVDFGEFKDAIGRFGSEP